MLRSERSPKDVICRFWMASENTPLKGIIKAIVNACWLPLQRNAITTSTKSVKNPEKTNE